MTNELQIESIKDKCLKSRIMHEYRELSKTYHNIIILYKEEKLIEMTITSKTNNTNEIHTFVIDKKYPFSPPIYHYNNHSYLHYLSLPSPKFVNVLKTLYNKSCLCCTSLYCKYNWSPAIKLHIFIDELSKIKKYKRNIVYKLLCDQIKRIFLNDDIPIERFLF